MKKYLREIQISGIILMLIGCIMVRFFAIQSGVIACGIGIALWLLVVIFKAFHWQDYERDNKQNIVMVLLIIALLLIMMFSWR